VLAGPTPELPRRIAVGFAVAASAVASAGDATGGGGDATSILSTVFVHPIVLLSVLDHHTRRQEGAGRVIGTLLGKRDGDRVR